MLHTLEKIRVSPITNATMQTENSKLKWQQKNATKIFDHTYIADRLKMVT